jgi:hypothetical protein
LIVMISGAWGFHCSFSLGSVARVDVTAIDVVNNGRLYFRMLSSFLIGVSWMRSL